MCVMTEANGLLYMRQRYYNPEIKRFINQDILRGDLSNSQSLNRYSYVQGNPVSFTDPFGLSPLKHSRAETDKSKTIVSQVVETVVEEPADGKIDTSLMHMVLGLLGCIPGAVGAIADAIDSLIYFVIDGDVANGLLSAFSAITFGAGKIAKAGGALEKSA